MAGRARLRDWAGKQIPAEAEWEYAARGGLPGSEFAWGDELTPAGRHMANTWQGEFPHQNLRLDGYAGTSPIGTFPANGYGLHDMIGNVLGMDIGLVCRPPERDGQRAGLLRHTAGPGQPGPRPGDGQRRTWSAGRAHPAQGHEGRIVPCAPNYCRRYRPAARMPQPIDTSTCHLGFRCIIRPAA